MQFLRRMPVEFYLLFFLFFIFSISSLFFMQIQGLGLGSLKFHLDHSLLFGEAVFSILSVVIIYGFLKLFFLIFNFKKSPKSPKNTLIDLGKKCLIYTRALIFWVLLIGFVIITYSYALEFVYHSANPDMVAETSELIMRMDHALFGVYPTFFLQGFASIGSVGFLALLAYRQILFIISIVILAALFINPKLLRKFIISFVLAGFIGLPLWSLVPAISPAEMYVANTMGRPIPEYINREISGVEIEKNMAEYLPQVLETWVDPTLQSFAISTFPSMHVAWGLITVVIGIEIFAPLAILLVPWMVFNVLGTVVTFEHYAVDSLFGILVAVIALYVAKKALQFESKYFADDYKLLALWHMLAKDARQIMLFTNKS